MSAHSWPAGWSLVSEDEDFGEEGRSRTFWLVNRDRVKHLLDVSQWRRDVPNEIISMMIDLGIPTREAFGVIHPLTDEMIEARWRQWAAGQSRSSKPCTGEAA